MTITSSLPGAPCQARRGPSGHVRSLTWNAYREGADMAYGVVHHFPGGTKEQYEASLAAVHPAPDTLPEGQVFHAAGPADDGWTIVAVHESQGSWERFRDGILLPRMQQ